MDGNYKTTIRLLNILQVIGWLTAIGGLFFGFRVFQTDGLMLAMLNFAPTTLAGLILMAGCQVGGVLIDLARSARVIEQGTEGPK